MTGPAPEPSRRRSSRPSAFSLDEVEIVITKRGTPVARLVPHRERPKSLFGADRGRMRIVGDIISPLDVEWEAEVNPDRVLNP